ncbi:WYL domain-containing protein [Streptomyces sp. NPDC059679]|uniref:WYL domain-containing protein n=1 Tax=Streptomyces sp. NPDC059679 TaxID=3346903 RepID=UPI0036BC004A
MKHTNRQTQHRTLTDLTRALDHRHAVTLTYRDRDNEITVRTVEIHELHAKTGDVEITAMCRLRKAERKFDVSRIISYTVHRMAYVLERPAPTKYERPAPVVAYSVQDLVDAELALDPDDADHTPRKKLTQTDTHLAA